MRMSFSPRRTLLFAGAVSPEPGFLWGPSMTEKQTDVLFADVCELFAAPFAV
jgi:hypothetical protein